VNLVRGVLRDRQITCKDATGSDSTHLVELNAQLENAQELEGVTNESLRNAKTAYSKYSSEKLAAEDARDRAKKDSEAAKTNLFHREQFCEDKKTQFAKLSKLQNAELTQLKEANEFLAKNAHIMTQPSNGEVANAVNARGQSASQVVSQFVQLASTVRHTFAKDAQTKKAATRLHKSLLSVEHSLKSTSSTTKGQFNLDDVDELQKMVTNTLQNMIDTNKAAQAADAQGLKTCQANVVKYGDAVAKATVQRQQAQSTLAQVTDDLETVRKELETKTKDNAEAQQEFEKMSQEHAKDQLENQAELQQFTQERGVLEQLRATLGKHYNNKESSAETYDAINKQAETSSAAVESGMNDGLTADELVDFSDDETGASNAGTVTGNALFDILQTLVTEQDEKIKAKTAEIKSDQEDYAQETAAETQRHQNFLDSQVELQKDEIDHVDSQEEAQDKLNEYTEALNKNKKELSQEKGTPESPGCDQLQENLPRFKIRRNMENMAIQQALVRLPLIFTAIKDGQHGHVPAQIAADLV